jgi:hypothetical protein
MRRIMTAVSLLSISALCGWALAQSPVTPPRPDRPAPTPDDIAALEARHLQLLEQELDARARAHEVEAELRKARLQYERERAAQKGAQAATGARTRELAVAAVKPADSQSGPEVAVYAVIATGPDGTPEDVFICSNLESLRQVLVWAKHDTSTKWQVVVRTSGSLLESRAHQHAFGAAQAVGFEGVKYAADPAESAVAAALDRLGWTYPSWKSRDGKAGD